MSPVWLPQSEGNSSDNRFHETSRGKLPKLGKGYREEGKRAVSSRPYNISLSLFICALATAPICVRRYESYRFYVVYYTATTEVYANEIFPGSAIAERTNKLYRFPGVVYAGRRTWSRNLSHVIGLVERQLDAGI